MTREEAIRELEILKEDFLDDDTMLALDLAIKALEQEPCEDCVSRQAVLAIVGDSCLDLDNYEDTKEFCDEINDLPPVTPTRKKGHWIMTNNYLTAAYGSIDYVKCSCCGEESLEEGDYCPNCGAKMEGEE